MAGSCLNGDIGISIHALLAESDRALRQLQSPLCYFYPRSPCGERPIGTLRTVSVRNFYPRSPCGERHSNFFQKKHPPHISIHALLAESDTVEFSSYEEAQKFLSTLSLRRATRPSLSGTAQRIYFYPRSPCGERRFVKIMIVSSGLFLSTLSLRRATG